MLVPNANLPKRQLVFLLLAALCSLERVLATRRLTDSRIDCRIGGYRYFGSKAWISRQGNLNPSIKHLH